LVIANIAGELVVRGWDERTVNVECELPIATLTLEGDTLIVGDAEDGVIISVPYETVIQAMRVSDDVSIVNVSQAELREARSDCFLKGIHGEVNLGRIHGGLRAEDVRVLRLMERVDRDASFVDVESLKATRIGGDVLCKNVHEAQFQYGIGGELEAENVEVLSASTIGRDCVIRGNGRTVVNLTHIGIDLEVHAVAKLRAQNIGANCEVHDCERAEVVLSNVGGALDVAGALSVEVHNVGRECELQDIQGSVNVRHVGVHVHVAGVGGNLKLGNVGAQAEIRGVQGMVGLGHIGGSLELQALFPPGSVTNVHVGGNVTIDLPDSANVTIQALAGGNVRDEHSGATYHNRAVLVYGEGVAQLRIKAGGNVNLRGSIVGRIMNENKGGWRDWQFAHNADYWGVEVAAVFDQKGHKRHQRMETQNRRRHEQRRRGEERARAARFREREIWVDPAGIDRIVEQARQAAADGIQGAFEAVDQALRNMHLSVPPSPHPPHPPHAPHPPMHPGVPNYEHARGEPGSAEAGVESPVEPLEANKASVDIEQEREAILHMIAEGRLTPDEGDMLLEALN
jgi:hypothetical protein